MATLYEQDFHQWAMDTAAALREGRTDEVDLNAVAEELEDLGRSEKRSLRSAIAQLYMHLLKIRYEPEKHTVSWDASVEKQRDEIEDLIADNPSLKRLLTDLDFITRAYRLAVQDAVRETGLPKKTFPDVCPFTFEDFGLPFTNTKRG
jgi:hypothetical protein